MNAVATHNNGSVSGLTLPQRHIARETALHAMKLVLAHPAAVHYTQDPIKRWQGIAQHKNPIKGEYPTEGDCSSTVTWALHAGLYLRFGQPDIVNGDKWEGGYTGTIGTHGRHVLHRNNVMRGDLVLYGSNEPWEHVAFVEGWWKGKIFVISHGSEAGPFELPFDYRPDVGQFRRFI